MSSGEAIRQDIVRQNDHLGSTRVDIAMQVANQMTDAGGLSQIAWVHNEHFFISRANNVRGLGVVMQQLPGMKNRAGWQFEREGNAVGRLDQPTDAAAIDGAHGQFDNR